MAAGGNIVVGDFYEPARDEGPATDGTDSTSFNFIMEVAAIFNRGEWIKTQPQLPGEPHEEQVGERTYSVTVYDYEWVEDTRTRPVHEWVTPMHDNPHYAGEDYIPRYYAFDEGTVAPILDEEGYFDPSNGQWHSEEGAGGWDEHELSYADPSDPYLYEADGTPKAVVSTFAPTSDWISNDLMRELIQHSLATRVNEKEDPLEVDATLYSANSILGVVPTKARDHTNGQLLVNGALVAADVGLLAPNGTQINYDSRGKDVLMVLTDDRLAMRQTFWAPAAEARLVARDVAVDQKEVVDPTDAGREKLDDLEQVLEAQKKVLRELNDRSTRRTGSGGTAGGKTVGDLALELFEMGERTR